MELKPEEKPIREKHLEFIKSMGNPVMVYYGSTMSNGAFNNIYSDKKMVAFCGKSEDQIKTLEVTFAEDQEFPTDSKSGEYWGWWCLSKNRLTLIQCSFIVFGIQFSYGPDIAEFVKEDGIAVRLNVKEIK